MATKLVGRIYLRRQQDILHILTIKADAKKGDIYFSMPASDQQKSLGLDNVKLSYHADGQTHITAQIPALLAHQDDQKRKITPGMGFKGDKAYAATAKGTPLSAIKDVIKVEYNTSYKDINTIDHGFLKKVTFDEVAWGSRVVDTKRFNDLSLHYFLVPGSMIGEGAGFLSDEYHTFKHPGLDMYIVVRIFDS